MSTLAVGIDIGGTKIAAGLIDVRSGEVRVATTHPTAPHRGGDAVLADCVDITADLLRDQPRKGDAVIGIGVPELVDQRGRIRSDFQFDWRCTDLVAAFRALGLPRVESDVRNAALAEATFGAARGAGSALYVSIGTGISSCFLIDGVPWRGHHGNALVLSSGPTMVPHPDTDHPVERVLEEMAAGPALVARLQQRGGGATSAEEVLAQAAAGDPVATQVVTSGARMLGNTIGQVVNVLDPEMVILGGGLGIATGLYRTAMERAMRDTIWSDQSRDVPLVTSQLGAAAGMVGAALTAWRVMPAGGLL